MFRCCSLETSHPRLLPRLCGIFFFNEGPRKYHAAATTAKLLQLCPTQCDPIDSIPPGSAAPGILQARTLEWVAMSFSSAWKWKVKAQSCPSLRSLAPGLQPTRPLHPWDFPGKSTGVSCLCLLWENTIQSHRYDVFRINKSILLNYIRTNSAR